MKLKTLISPHTYYWALQYYKKHFLKSIRFYFDYMRKKTFYEVMINGTQLKLFFSHPYHHLIVKELHKNKCEYTLLSIWQEACKDADTILDIGSYNGIYALVAVKANPKATVVAYEPDKINCKHIIGNQIQNNLSFKIQDCAVADKSGFLNFASHDGGTGGSIGNGQPVLCTILDNEYSEGKILIKLDVEGSEYDVLKGATETLKKDVTILLEVHKEFIKKQGHTVDELFALIKERGYRLLWLDENPLTAHYWMYKL